MKNDEQNSIQHLLTAIENRFPDVTIIFTKQKSLQILPSHNFYLILDDFDQCQPALILTRFPMSPGGRMLSSQLLHFLRHTERFSSTPIVAVRSLASWNYPPFSVVIKNLDKNQSLTNNGQSITIENAEANGKSEQNL